MIPLGMLASARMAPAAGGGSVTAALVGSGVWTATSGPTVTISGVGLGSATDRTLVVILMARVATGGSTHSATVAGYPVTFDVANGTNFAAGIGRVTLPASVTAGNVVVTTGNSWRREVRIYEASGPIAPAYTASKYGDFAQTLSAGPLPGAAEGFTIAAAAYSTNTVTWEWTGLPEVSDAEAMTTAFLAGSPSIPDLSVYTPVSGPRFGGLAAVTYAPVGGGGGVEAITDNFDTLSSSWAIINGAWAAAGSSLRQGTNTVGDSSRKYVYHTDHLLSADHYAEARLLFSNSIGSRGLLIRLNDATGEGDITGYMADMRSGTISKVMSGVVTTLASASLPDPGSSVVHRLAASGTALTYYRDGVLQNSVTDSSIRAGTHIGFWSVRDSTFDDLNAQVQY